MDKVKAFFLVAISILLSGYFCVSASKIFAADSYSVTANVASPISKEKSEIKINASSTLADPVNHPIVFFVQLKDQAGQPLAGRTVTVESDRGSVDIIEAASKISSYTVQAADNSSLNTDESDDNGRVAFRVTSFVPGDAKISLIADSVVRFNPVNITFKALPFPWYVSINFQSPLSNKVYEIFSNQIEMKKLSSSQAESAVQNNIGTVITLSFWVLLLFLFFVVFPPLMAVVNYIGLMRMRREDEDREQVSKIHYAT